MNDDRMKKLETLVEPILDGLDGLGKGNRNLVLSVAVAAADTALDPARSCGGNCTECQTIKRDLGPAVLKICDGLEQVGSTVYRKPERIASPLAEGGTGIGAFY